MSRGLPGPGLRPGLRRLRGRRHRGRLQVRVRPQRLRVRPQRSPHSSLHSKALVPTLIVTGEAEGDGLWRKSPGALAVPVA